MGKNLSTPDIPEFRTAFSLKAEREIEKALGLDSGKGTGIEILETSGVDHSGANCRKVALIPGTK